MRPQQQGNAASHLLRLLVRYERHDIPQHRIMVGRSATQRGQRALSVAQRAGDVTAPARVGAAGIGGSGSWVRYSMEALAAWPQPTAS